MNSFVYILRLATGKHYYIGSAKDLEKRLNSHCRRTKNGMVSQAVSWGSRATRTYGFSGLNKDILLIVPCSSRDNAYKLEWDLACKYRQLFPDVCICSDSYSFGTFNSDQLE